MAVASYIERYRYARLSLFRWRYEVGVVEKVALALGMAAFTGLVAQLRVPLPFTPVPITGQTFAVMLAGVLLGRWYGGLSQALYAAIGAAGVGWFANWSGGWGTFTGPTGGYIVGFILAAFFVGHFTDRYIGSRGLFPMLGLMLLANFILIHVPGLLWLSRFPYEEWLRASSVLGLGPYEGRGLLQLLMVGTIPFIVGDVIKAAAAASAAKGVTPKVAYNGEVDASRYGDRQF